MDDFQKRSQSTTKIESIADMKVKPIFYLPIIFKLPLLMIFFRGVCGKLSAIQKDVRYSCQACDTSW
jgi:hypothetical protein